MANQQNPEKKEKSDIRPVAKGERKEPSIDRKLKDVFISDNAGSVGDYLVWDVLVPGVKNMISTGLHGAIDSIFGSRGGYKYSGSSYQYGRSQPSYQYGRTDYAGRSVSNDYRQSRSRDSEVVLHSWAEAEEVRDSLCEIIDRYGAASVSDLNALTQQSDRDHTDGNWGWRDISRSSIRMLRDYFGPGDDGYLLELPRPMYLKD